MKRLCWYLATILVLALPCAAQYAFTTVDYPGATATRLIGLNDNFEMVGHYILPGQVRHAMRYSRGIFTPLDPTGLLGMNPSGATQINNRGQITGWYTAAGKRHGFLYQNGVVTTLDYPGSISGQANGVSDEGVVIGQFQDPSGTIHGYIYKEGVFTQLDFPGAVDTIPYYINARGDIAGEWDPSLTVIGHGFVLTGTGEWISFDAPGAPENSTLAIGISDQQQILGAYLAGNQLHTFVVNLREVSVPEAYTFIALPGAGAWPETGNSAGVFVGYFNDSTGTHGYVAIPRPGR